MQTLLYNGIYSVLKRSLSRRPFLPKGVGSVNRTGCFSKQRRNMIYYPLHVCAQSHCILLGYIQWICPGGLLIFEGKRGGTELMERGAVGGD